LFSLIFSHNILIGWNKLTGLIPTEIGLLTNLKEGDYYYNYNDARDSYNAVSDLPKIENDDYYYLFDGTEIEVSDGDYYYNDARDNYNAVSDLPEIETEIEI